MSRSLSIVKRSRRRARAKAGAMVLHRWSPCQAPFIRDCKYGIRLHRVLVREDAGQPIRPCRVHRNRAVLFNEQQHSVGFVAAPEPREIVALRGEGAKHVGLDHAQASGRIAPQTLRHLAAAGEPRWR